MVQTPFQAIPEGTHMLRLVGEIDLATVTILRDALRALPTEGTVTLDLSELEFIDSTGLHEVVLYAQSLNGNRPLRLVNVPGPLALVLKLVEFDKLDAIEIQ